MTDRFRRGVTLLVLVASFAVLLVASRTQGNVRDEGYYFDAAEQYSAWYVGLLPNVFTGHLGKSFSRSAVDHAFSYNHEHPALMKSLFGLSWHFLHKCDCPKQPGLHPMAYRQRHASLNLLDEETAFRVPTMLLTALMIAFTFAWAARFSAAAGLGAGLAAAGMTLFASRLFFDAELACFDAPIAALWFLTVYAYWRSRSQDRAGRRWAIGAGVIFGLALATKHNAFFIPPVLILHALVVDARELLASLRERRWPRAEAFPRALLWMASLGLVVYLACWPWMWFATVARFREYVAFHVNHVYYNFEYLGRNYNKPAFPRSFVFVMTLLTVPTTTLLLAFAGAAAWLRRARNGGVDQPPGTGLLIGLNALAPMLVLTLSGAPIFGATKHFHAAIPFIALLAAFALALLLRGLGSPRVLAFGLPLLAVLPSAVDTWRSHPYGLSHYVAFAGGPDGGATLGMNRQFWGYATRGLLPYINAHAAKNAPVYWHDTNQAQINLYVRTGRARTDLRNTGLEEPGVQASNLGLVIHERHFSKYEYWFWDFYGTTQPAAVLTHEDVPVVTLYERQSKP